MSLRGNLSDFGVADIFQLIAQQRKTGVLTVGERGREFEVYFVEGRVVRARPREKRPQEALAEYLIRTGAVSGAAMDDALREQDETCESLAEILIEAAALDSDDVARTGRLISDEVIFALFLLEEGSFRFNPRDVAPEPGDESVGAEQVLLNALRMQDEWQEVSGLLPDLDWVACPVADIERFRSESQAIAERCGMKPEAVERLFTLCDGRLAARRAIDLSRLGSFQGGKALVALSRSGVIEFREPRVAEVHPKPSSLVSTGRWLAPIAVMVALATAALLFSTMGLAPREGSALLPADGLAQSRRTFERDRIRQALEVRRWLGDASPEAPGPGAGLEGADAGGYPSTPGPPGSGLQPQGH